MSDKLTGAKQQATDWAKKMQNGEPLDPALQQSVAQKLVAGGMPPEQANAKATNMDWGSSIAVGLGLGLGTVGLIHSMTSENGGIGSWILSLLGLGVGAGGLAYRGAFGAQAQQAVQGGVHSLMGNGPKGVSTMGAIASPYVVPQIQDKLKQQNGLQRMAPDSWRKAEIQKQLAAHPLAGMLPASDHAYYADQALK